MSMRMSMLMKDQFQTSLNLGVRSILTAGLWYPGVLVAGFGYIA